MMASGAMPAGQRLVEVVGEAVAVAVDDALRQPLLDRPVASGPPSPSPVVSTSSKSAEQRLQRVVARRCVAAVVDEVEADLAPARRGCG